MSIIRKLPRDLECPIDNVLLDIVEYINPYFYKLGFTPNLLTFISALFGIAACINCWYNYYTFASVNYFIGYFFDCADGNFARHYNLTSKFGDIFDHTKDIVVSFSLMGILIYKHGITPLTNLLLIIFYVFFFMNNLYLGQQERYTKAIKSDFLELFTMKSSFSLNFLKYFGCGILNTYVCISILILRRQLKF